MITIMIEMTNKQQKINKSIIHFLLSQNCNTITTTFYRAQKYVLLMFPLVYENRKYGSLNIQNVKKKV